MKSLTPKYPHMLHGGDYNPDQWLDRPDILEEDIRLMKEAHINCVSVGIFAWAKLEPQEGVYAWDALDAQYGFRDLRARGIHVVTHVILCLPGEGREEMLQTARYVGQHSDGIKLQLLHVLEGTDLAADYRAGRVPLPTLEEYVALVRDCVKVLPEDMVVHRMTGDGPKRMLLAPQWSGDKKRVLNALNRALERS